MIDLVKILDWRNTGADRYSAVNEDYKVVTDGTNWAFCPEDWPPFGGYPYKTCGHAKAAAQADYAARIIAALNPEALAALAENERLRELVGYIAGTNTDHVRVALAGNPTVCDHIIERARSLAQLKEPKL
jgi:regulator of protease activity HflC (stomatin/prohibitin superfamily)